jgi:capsular polysaccharide biosynthesis protein
MRELTEYSPLETFESAVAHWRLVVILTIVGGLVGLIFHWLRPPVYDATISFTIGIDFKNVGRELTQYEEDVALGAAGGLILSSQVVDKVVAQAQAQQIEVGPAELMRISTLERRQAIWELRVRHTNPEAAETLANLWGRQAFADLREARHNAWQAYRIYDELQILKQCFQAPSLVTAPETLCGRHSPVEVEQIIVEKEVEFDNRLQAARGILPALIFDLSGDARRSGSPVAFNVNLLVLSGGLIGFLIGVVYSSQKTRRR